MTAFDFRLFCASWINYLVYELVHKSLPLLLGGVVTLSICYFWPEDEMGFIPRRSRRTRRKSKTA